jgi:hypothetical protein
MCWCGGCALLSVSFVSESCIQYSGICLTCGAECHERRPV